jgi:hypothetical protein
MTINNLLTRSHSFWLFISSAHPYTATSTPDISEDSAIQDMVLKKSNESHGMGSQCSISQGVHFPQLGPIQIAHNG